MATWILVPAYRAEASLGPLLDRIRRSAPGLDVMVVDDGSPDGTGRAASEAGALLVRHALNLGKGAALRTGFSACLEAGASGVITMDADGQHPPEHIGAFLQAARGADLVLGCRMGRPAAMPRLRLQTNRFLSRVVSGLARTPMRDTQCGYRWISAALLRAVPVRASRYEAESEILIRAARRGFRIREIEVPSVYAVGGSAIRPVPDTLRFLRMAAGFL